MDLPREYTQREKEVSDLAEALNLVLIVKKDHWTSLQEEYRDKPDLKKNIFNKAVEKGHSEIVKGMLGENKDDSLKISPCALFTAIEKGHTEVVKLVLSDATMNAQLDPWSIKVGLNRAAMVGTIEIVKLFLNLCVKPKKLSFEALKIASKHGNCDVVAHLLQGKAADSAHEDGHYSSLYYSDVFEEALIIAVGEAQKVANSKEEKNDGERQKKILNFQRTIECLAFRKGLFNEYADKMVRVLYEIGSGTYIQSAEALKKALDQKRNSVTNHMLFFSTHTFSDPNKIITENLITLYEEEGKKEVKEKTVGPAG